MLAQNDKYINEASETIYQLTREDYYRRQRSWDDRIAKAMKIEAEHDRLIAQNDKLTADIDKLTAENKELKVTVEELTATITRQEASIAKQDASIATLIAAMEANGITINT